LSRNRHCYVAMEMLQTHCYATGTVTLLWKRHQRLNMSQYCYALYKLSGVSIVLLEFKASLGILS
jgi:hypothetical protein